MIRNGRQFRSAPPPALRSKDYARDYDEVKRVGEAQSKERPEDRTQVARFYALRMRIDLLPGSAPDFVDAGGRLPKTRACSRCSRWRSGTVHVACFETKYHFNLWRPVTAIRRRPTEPQDAARFKVGAAVFTPPFPAYPSGHASFGGAARAVLEDEFGADGHVITLSHPAVPDIVLRYTTFKQITDDIDDARIYGGVHYRFDQEAGALQGKRVGEYFCDTRCFRPASRKQRHRHQ